MSAEMVVGVLVVVVCAFVTVDVEFESIKTAEEVIRTIKAHVNILCSVFIFFISSLCRLYARMYVPHCYGG